MSKYAFLALSILLFTFTNCQKEQLVNTAIDSYLQANHAAIDFNDIKSGQSILTDSIIKTNQLFIISENHGVASNPTTRLFFIKLLHQQTDTLCYFPELSFAACQFLNKYLQTSDETLLGFIYDNYKGTFEYSKENVAFWQELRSYTQTLIAPKKLIIIGLDVEHQPPTAMRYIKELLGTTTPPTAIASTVDELKNKATLSYTRPTDKNWLRQQIEAFNLNKTAFQSFLADKFANFEHTLINMQNAVDAVTLNSLQVRERYLFDNFKKLYPLAPKGKWFGQWGGYHALQRASHSSLANFINSSSDSPLKGSVLTIYSFYENAFYMNQISYNAILFSNINPTNPYTTVATTNFTLFRLNNTNSPFLKELIWQGTDEALESGTTTNYFQFVYFVKNAKAMTAYK